MNRRSSHTGTVQPLRQRLKQATRAAILDAAEAVFSVRGFNAARMEEIAERAGVAVGTLYNYFADRRAILEAVLDASARELSAKMAAERPAAPGSFAQQIEGFLRIAVAHVEAHFRFYAVLVEEELESGRGGAMKKRPIFRLLYDLASELVARGVEGGALRPEDAILYPALLVGMMRGVFMRHLCVDARTPLSSQVGPMVRFFLEGAGRGEP